MSNDNTNWPAIRNRATILCNQNPALIWNEAWRMAEAEERSRPSPRVSIANVAQIQNDPGRAARAQAAEVFRKLVYEEMNLSNAAYSDAYLRCQRLYKAEYAATLPPGQEALADPVKFSSPSTVPVADAAKFFLPPGVSVQVYDAAKATDGSADAIFRALVQQATDGAAEDAKLAKAQAAAKVFANYPTLTKNLSKKLHEKLVASLEFANDASSSSMDSGAVTFVGPPSNA